MGKALVALDTDHIKEYVFGTDKLKEIRGASSILDYLNRYEMKRIGETDAIQARCIYANGGSGLFVVDEEHAEAFAKQVQLAYREKSGGTSSITYAFQPIPVPDNISEDELMDYPLENELLLLQYHLEQAKNSPPLEIALTSHPLMSLCNSCGVEYAAKQIARQEDDEDEQGFYCLSCFMKHKRDITVKKAIEKSVKHVNTRDDEDLWNRVIKLLHTKGYRFPEETLPQRPKNFNVFQKFPGAKSYLGLIYADGNGMGKALMKQDTLGKRCWFAKTVDDSIFDAMATAISLHLKIQNISEEGDLFPFDILLIGGDDIVMVTPAANAPDIALTIAQEFQHLTYQKGLEREENKNNPEWKGYTLSVGVVLAPIKYPFGLVHGLAEGALKFAKKKSLSGESRINFVTIAGSISQSFDKVYQSLSKTRTKNDPDDTPEFYATLRPYNTEQFNRLLSAIRRGHELGLGRTKLHQLREAILKRNLTTSVNDALATVRNWRKDQREYIVNYVYTLAGQHQEQYCNPDDPSTWFPRVTFPWFANDRKDTYHTTLLDFIELYDFVAGEESEDSDNEA